IGEVRAFRDQLLALGVVDQPAAGRGADERRQQPGADGRRGALVHCSFPSPPPAPAMAKRISVVSVSARAGRSGASSSACFSSTAKGHIIESESTSISGSASRTDSQSEERLATSK